MGLSREVGHWWLRRASTAARGVGTLALVLGIWLTALPPAGQSASAAGLNVNLDQWANKPGQGWQNGDLNGNNSAYAEGRVVPFRLAIEETTAGVHTINIQWQFTAAGHKAYDYLATWNATESADLCAAGGGGRSSLCDAAGGLGAASTMQFPSDTFVPIPANGLSVAGAEASGGVSRLLTMYGGTIKSISAAIHEGPVDANSNGTFTVTFSATGTAVAFAWGGHLARSSYWEQAAPGGVANGAGTISGAPWHVRTQQFDNSSNKNQDRSIQSSAIQPIPTATPTNTPTSTPTNRPTNNPTNTPTNTPGANQPTNTPTSTPTRTPASTPASAPTSTPAPQANVPATTPVPPTAVAGTATPVLPAAARATATPVPTVKAVATVLPKSGTPSATPLLLLGAALILAGWGTRRLARR